MHIDTDRVSGAMDEVLTVSCIGDEGASGLVDFPPVYEASGLKNFLHGANACLASIANHSEDFLVTLGGLPDNSCPSDVVVHGACRVLLAQDIEQDKVPYLDGGGTLSLWFKVR